MNNKMNNNLKEINPFEFIKNNADDSYIIGRYIYEQEPCMVTIDYIVKENIDFDTLQNEILEKYEHILLDKEDILYIPYSVFTKYMNGRIDDYVDDKTYELYNTTRASSIYKFNVIVIDLMR